MPTFSRLAAAICFGIAAFFAGTEYYTLYEEPPRSASGILFIALVAAVIGWKFVGARLGAGLMQNFSMVIQGYIATLLTSFFLLGFYNAFTMGYRQRYRSLDDAFQGFFDVTTGHLMRMSDISFLLMLLIVAVVLTGVLTLTFRLAERRRLDL